MEKVGRWLKSFLTGKKEEKQQKRETLASPLPTEAGSAPIPVPTLQRRRRDGASGDQQ